MNIFITNDDGIDSPGLEALEEALGGVHNLHFFAPDRERSGQSHGITLKGPIRVKQRSPGWFSCDGTPADCVTVGIRGGFVPFPDLILSGINTGPNLGTDTVYSGTVAGARQGALMGIPSLALSSASLRGPWDLQGAAQWLAGNLESVLARLENGFFGNINFPSPLDPQATLQEGTLCIRSYEDTIEKFLAPGKEFFCFVRGNLGDTPPSSGSDWWAVNQGRISFTALSAQPSGAFLNALELRS